MNRHRWLPFLALGFVGILVFVLFVLRLMPVRPPEASLPQTDGTALDQPTVTYVNPSIGAADPAVTIVVFGDFLCESCRTQASSLADVLTRYPDAVRIVWKNFPNESIHALATPAAIAAMCAQQQGQFWQYHDLLFANQTSLSDTAFDEIAGALGLDQAAFSACVDAQDPLPVIQRDFEEALGLQIAATPALFVNGERFVGAVSTQELLTHVQAILAK